MKYYVLKIKNPCKIKIKYIFYCIIMATVSITTEKYISLEGISDYWYYVLIFIVLLCTITIHEQSNVKKRKLSKCIIFYSGLIVISFINSTLIWKQPIMISLIVHSCLIIPLFYYPLISIIRYISIDTTKHIFELLGIFVSLVTIFQKRVYPDIQFLMNIGMRNGKLRIISGSSLVVFAFIIAFSDLISKRKCRKCLLLVCALLLYDICFIIQTRSTIFTVIVTSIFLIWIRINKRVMSGIIKNVINFVILLIIAYLAFYYIQLVVADSIEMKEVSSIQRIGAIKFYISQLKKHPILGYGMFREDFVLGRKLTGFDYEYYIDDVGIVGYIFQFGITGFIFIVYLIIKIIANIKVISNENKIVLYGIFLYVIIKLPFNCFLNISSAMIYVPIFLAVLEVSYEEREFEICRFISGNTHL